MIKNFVCKETEKIWKAVYSKKNPNNIQSLARRKLRMLNNSDNLYDLRFPPTNNLEALKGKRKDEFSIKKISNGEYVSVGYIMMLIM